MLRRLRVLNFAGELLDDSDTLELAAEQAGLPVAELAAWAAAPEVEAALRADMARRAHARRRPRARRTTSSAGPTEERRYTCPSYELMRATDPPRGLADGAPRRPARASARSRPTRRRSPTSRPS